MDWKSMDICIFYTRIKQILYNNSFIHFWKNSKNFAYWILGLEDENSRNVKFSTIFNNFRDKEL